MSSESTNIDRLYEAGVIVDASILSEAHMSFLNGLSEDEVATLIGIKQKLDAAGIPILPYPPHAAMPIL